MKTNLLRLLLCGLIVAASASISWKAWSAGRDPYSPIRQALIKGGYTGCVECKELKVRLRKLGPVDEVPHPQPDGGDEDEAEIAVGGLVVSGGQSAAVLEL
jgi:hypothetical protein